MLHVTCVMHIQPHTTTYATWLQPNTTVQYTIRRSQHPMRTANDLQLYRGREAPLQALHTPRGPPPQGPHPLALPFQSLAAAHISELLEVLGLPSLALRQIAQPHAEPHHQ